MSACCLIRSLSAVPMPWPALVDGAQQNRMLRLVRLLQARRHLARMIGRDAAVVRAGHHQDGRILRAVVT